MSDHVVKHNLKITFLNLFLFPSADRAMLEALGGHGERSIISEKRTGNGDEDGEKSQSLKHGGSEEENDATKEEEKRDKDESRERHLSESEEWSKEKAEKRQDEEVEEEEEELNKEKRGNSGEEAMTKNEKGIFLFLYFVVSGKERKYS